jgi:Putative prokaryotic signal transducing protein
MQTLYEAANALEAHMLRDLLKQQGIAAELHGEHLPGALGELPAAGLVRLVVDEADHPRARQLVEQWDAAQPAEPPLPRTRGAGQRLGAFALGLALGLGGAVAYYRSPAGTDGRDHDRDGVVDDTWSLAASGQPLRRELDRNFDHRTDHVLHFDPSGEPRSAEADDDFDGRFETRERYLAGQVLQTETDTDGDGYPDLRSDYTDGVLSSVTRLNPATGLPLRVDHFRLGGLLTSEVDTDRDGVLDTRLHLDALGDAIRRERLAPAPSTPL